METPDESVTDPPGSSKPAQCPEGDSRSAIRMNARKFASLLDELEKEELLDQSMIMSLKV